MPLSSFGERGVKVMLDRDLAELYQVETRRLNEQVKRNPNRHPGLCSVETAGISTA